LSKGSALESITDDKSNMAKAASNATPVVYNNVRHMPSGKIGFWVGEALLFGCANQPVVCHNKSTSFVSFCLSTQYVGAAFATATWLSVCLSR